MPLVYSMPDCLLMHSDGTEAVLSDTVCFLITRMQATLYIENHFVWGEIQVVNRQSPDAKVAPVCGTDRLQTKHSRDVDSVK